MFAKHIVGFIDRLIGKTTVARLYAQFLASIRVLPGTEFIETTGSRLANEGVPGAKKHIEQILNAGGGALFLDEAYQLADGRNAGNTTVLDFLLAEIENRVGKVVFILAGYVKEMEKFFEHNPGLDSRLPHRLHFADYIDDELLVMLCRLIKKKYKDRAKIEGGVNGLYARIAVRRLGRGRGREGYGNARALENVWAKISERQAERLQGERAAGANPDDFFFTKEDIIGPEPSDAIRDSAAWKKLHGLIGLKSVKDSIKGLVDRMQLNYERELEEKPPIEVSLNRIFLGSPGTGKTSVGKLYGEILADMGLLSKREGKKTALKSSFYTCFRMLFICGAAPLHNNQSFWRRELYATEQSKLMCDFSCVEEPCRLRWKCSRRIRKEHKDNPKSE